MLKSDNVSHAVSTTCAFGAFARPACIRQFGWAARGENSRGLSMSPSVKTAGGATRSSSWDGRTVQRKNVRIKKNRRQTNPQKMDTHAWLEEERGQGHWRHLQFRWVNLVWLRVDSETGDGDRGTGTGGGVGVASAAF